jgi:peptidoglycan/LPS O-acetylase OafA/YrhL
VAVALVLAMHFVHAPEDTWWGSAIYRLAHMGWIGVDLFFVLSGFLITGILLDTKERPGTSQATVGWYARLCCRGLHAADRPVQFLS